MFTAEIDTKGLNLLMSRFAKESRKGIDEVIEQQMGMIVGGLIAMTPPGASKGQAMNDRGGITAAAKKKGEGRIRADIVTLFPTTRMKEPKVWGLIENGYYWGTGRGRKKIIDYASSIHDLRRVHKAARSKSSGRVRTGLSGQNMAMTTAALRNAYAKEQIKKVGILNAGWLKASGRLKTAKRATPAWITRHGAKPGGVSFRKGKYGLSITVSNRMPYFPKDMQARMQRAVERRERGIEKALAAMLERKAKNATQRSIKRALKQS